MFRVCHTEFKRMIKKFVRRKASERRKEEESQDILFFVESNFTAFFAFEEKKLQRIYQMLKGAPDRRRCRGRLWESR